MNEQASDYNAKTPEQKREIIERLYQVWLKHPEQRLGEMMSIANRRYAHDFKLIEDLEWLYEQTGKRK